jgi:hypothetical protein
MRTTTKPTTTMTTSSTTTTTRKRTTTTRGPRRRAPEARLPGGSARPTASDLAELARRDERLGAWLEKLAPFPGFPDRKNP